VTMQARSPYSFVSHSMLILISWQVIALSFRDVAKIRLYSDKRNSPLVKERRIFGIRTSAIAA
jgi:hypothetical protein